MKTRSIIILTVLASILTLGLTLAACNSNASDGPDLPLQQTFWTSTTDGTIYRLTITQNAARTAFTPTPGDAYVFDIIKNGVVVNTSRGTVQVYTNNSIVLQPVYAGAEIFTVLVSNDQITNISGPITVEESNTPVSPPPSGSFNDPGTNGNSGMTVTVTGVTVSPSTATVARNGTQQFTATVAGTNNPAQTVYWTVSTDTGNVNGTSISSTGLLTVGPNQNPTTLTVTATSTIDATKSGTASVTVPNPGNSGQIAVTGVSLNKTTLSLIVNGTETLTAAVAPNNATNKAVTWASSAPAVATVNSNGLVTAVSAGSATITATTVDGGKTASCTVTVSVSGHDGTPGLAFELINNGAAYSVSKGTVTSGVVVIPSTNNGLPVKEIAYNAFESSDITGITIPSSVTSIGSSAFAYCTSIENITIPPNITSISLSAFFGCTSLSSIIIPSSVTSIGESAFNGCASLTSIAIPSSVISIGNGAFANCSNLSSITIPSGVTSISQSMFWGCNNLTSIIIPSGVTSIGSWAFNGCTSLINITIPAGVTSIGNKAFWSWLSSQTIDIQGHANEASADASWGADWRGDCNAIINYQG